PRLTAFGKLRPRVVRPPMGTMRRRAQSQLCLRPNRRDRASLSVHRRHVTADRKAVNRGILRRKPEAHRPIARKIAGQRLILHLESCKRLRNSRLANLEYKLENPERL